MLIDKNLEFASSQAVTATAISNVIDLGATPTLKNIAPQGMPIYLVIQVDTSITQSGSGTNTISLESDSTADLATSATVHLSTGAIAKATLVAGYTLIYPLPVVATYERYLGVRFTVSETDTAGAYSAFLTCNPEVYTAYPDGLTANNA